MNSYFVARDSGGQFWVVKISFGPGQAMTWSSVLGPFPDETTADMWKREAYTQNTDTPVRTHPGPP